MSQFLKFGNAGSSGVLTLTGDAGGAISPVAGDIILAGGTGISTSGAGHTITISLTGGLGTTDHAVQVGNATGGITSLAVGATGTVLIGTTTANPSFSSTVALANGGSVETTTTAADAFTLRAYNTLATTYTTFATLTAGNPPTCDLASGVTIGTNYIYRVGGTDVAVADGGTGLSTLTAHALYAGNAASAPTALAVGATGEILQGNTGADPSWLAAGDANKVLTAHGAGSAPTWETPSSGGMTWAGNANASISLAVSTGYVLTHTSLQTCTLPATAAVGDRIGIVGSGTGLWKVAQNASQYIILNSSTSTTGVTGYISSNQVGDCVELICVVTNNGWMVRNSEGNINVV